MMMCICHWLILVLLLLLTNTPYSNAESIITVDMGSMKGSRDTSLMAFASVKIDNDDLFTMPKFTFTGMWDGEDVAVYTKTEATSRKMDSGAKETVWRGVIEDEDGNGFATLIRDDDGNVFGTFTANLAAYDLLNIPGGNPQVRAILRENAIPGTGIVEGETFLVESSSRETNQEPVIAGSFKPDHSGNIVTTIGEEAVVLENVNRKLIRLGEERSLLGNPVVEILVLVTDRARCEWVGLSSGCLLNYANKRPMDDQILVLQTVTNDAMSAVGTGVTVRIVETIYLGPGYDVNPTVSVLDDIIDEPSWRKDCGADLVVMITGKLSVGTTVSGIAYINSYASVVSIDYLSLYVFTYEIAHSFGCNHNRESMTYLYHHPYAHALRVPEKAFRTVMAYKCDTYDTVCPVIPYYSAKGYTYKGALLGDDKNDNARLIRERAPIVASWMGSKTPPPPPPVSSPVEVPKPITTAPTPAPSCFSSFNTVDVKDVGEIHMNKLKIGDFVKTKNEKFTQVYGFGHYDHDMQQEFIRIILDNDTSKKFNIPFEVSTEHLVFVERNKKLHSIPASEIIVGDHLAGDGKKVVAIYTVSRRGVYAPLTESGDLFVNGRILASNYVNVLHSGNSILDQHRLGHALVYPQRLLCSYYINICKKETYINGYGFLVYIIIQIGSIINMSGWFGNMIVSLLSIPLIVFVSILESITMFRLICVLAGTLAVVGRITLMKKVSKF